MERNTRTKAEREYVKGIIQNLSFKRITDQEIVDYLHNEKHIEIARSTVINTRNAIEKQAEKWYIDLRNSAYKYLAQYKQRIDSLLSYQRTLHDIISDTKKDEVKIRAISELHSIEMDILSVWKQLPAPNIVNTVDNTENEKKVPWAVQIGGAEEENKIPKAIAYGIPGIGDCEIPKSLPSVDGVESEPWTVDNNKESTATANPIIGHGPEPKITTSLGKLSTDRDPDLSKESETKDAQKPEQEQEPKQNDKQDDAIDIDLLGRWPKPFDVEPWVQCKFNNSNCNKWFKTKEIRTKHIAKYHA